ncbi:MAG: PotD/PotF family extracellular solute-binding protein, partial [Coriobacteriales bacterium]
MMKSINRRSFFKLTASAAALTAMGGLLTGCGGSKEGGSSETAGAEYADLSGITLGMMNYEGWMGETEEDDFQDATGCKIKQYATPDGGDSAWVNAVSKNEGVYDLTLAGIKVSTTLYENGLLAEFDASKVPNLSYVPDSFKEAFPYGIPTDQGKVGFMYNTELLPEPPASWKELFERAAEYDQKLILPNFDTDVIDGALLALGKDINTDSVADIEAAKDLVIGIKPHVKAFLDYGGAEAVADGSAVICVGYDYEFASMAADADNIAWLAPEEGCFGYLEGWVPLAGSENLDAVYELMNFHLAPENYAGFINTTWASWVEEGV